MAGPGKWGDPDVPQNGWTCESMYDHGFPEPICEMCEYKVIRYVHVMSHPEYPDLLHTGCVCTGNMEGDEGVAAEEREREIKNKAARRKNFMTKEWAVKRAKNSGNLNPYLKIGSKGKYIHFLIYKWDHGFTWMRWGRGIKHKSDYVFSTIEAAKLDIFDYYDSRR